MALPELIPLEVLFGNPERTQPSLSKDGKKIAFLAPDEGVLNVFVADVTDPLDAKPVTNDRKRGVQIYHWAYDNRHILFLKDTDGDENWRLYSVDVTTLDIVDRTPFDGVYTQILGMSERKPDEVVLGLNHRDPRYHDVFRLNLASGELTQEFTNEGFDDWLVDHDLVVRGATRPRDDGGIQYVLRDGPEWDLFIEVEPDDYTLAGTNPFGFSGDNERIFLPWAAGSDTTRLVSFDLETKEMKVLASDPSYDISFSVSMDPVTHEPQLVGFMKDRFDYQVLDGSLADDLAVLKAAGPGDVYVFSRTLDDSRWLAMHVVDDGPGRYSLYERSTKTVTFLFENQPALSGCTLANVEPFSFTSRDGLTVHGYATFPPGVERSALPTVLNVHGGPWGARHMWGFTPTNQWLANRGYLCLEIDYRGSGGYGKAFINASAREWAGRMHDDLLDGLEWAIEQGSADRDRLAIYGGSYGGYAALVGATFTPDVFRCAVDIVGPSNLITLLESIPPYWFALAKQFKKLLGDVETEKEYLWSRSPLSRVDDIRIPILIAQGANDPRVKQAEAEQIVAAMAERRLDHEYMLFEDEGHGFARPENREKFQLAAERFLAKHLGGRAQDAV